jgi:hypothetical protein
LISRSSVKHSKIPLSYPTIPVSLIPTSPMSPPFPPAMAASAFQSSFSYALRSYKKRTREDLLLHPLAARLQSCNSPGDALSVLQEQAQAFDQSPSGEERLTEWLGSTVNVLCSLSSSLGDGVGLVIILCFPFNNPLSFIFSGTIAR